MIRRRVHRSDEILLIPFLDILCSLIGVLVLIIVVLCVSQTQKVSGRTTEEIERAQNYLKLIKAQKENKRINELLKDKVAKLEKLQAEVKRKEEESAKIRKLLDASNADRQTGENLMKELDNLLIEIVSLAEQISPLKKKIAELQAEIAKRNPPANKDSAVLIQPEGSGLAKGSKVFFVEASAGKLTFYWNEQSKNVVAATSNIIAVDVAFNAFLKSVLDVPQGKIMFLIRDDGMGAYNLGAGWAQTTYGYKVEQMGKLPIPGRGEVDFRMFKEFLGSIPVPPEVTAPAPPAPPK